MLISIAHAQEAAQQADTMSTLMSFAPFLVLFAAIYFIMIRPQMRRQKEHRALVDGVAIGDEVITASGILGKITEVDEQFLYVQIASGVTVQLQRQAIAQTLPKGTIKINNLG